MAQPETRKTLNVKSFLEDFERGTSNDELRERFSLTASQLTRVIGVLKQKGRINQDLIASRAANLKIRFGTPDGPPSRADQGQVAVDLDTGLVLHCPSCGAPVERGAENCEYCKAHLDFSLQGKTINCPHCFARTPADGCFCMRCARPIQGLVKEGEVLKDRPCPRCEIAMRAKQIGDFSVIECTGCGGVFIPHETFEMMQDNSGRVIFATQGIQRPQLQPEQSVRYVRCPVCLKMMNRQNFARISGVIVDVCRGHGIWFDFGEVEKIMDFIAHGGLQKAKEVDLERLKAEEDLEKIRNIQTHGNSETHYASSVGTLAAGAGISEMIGSLMSILKE